MKSFGRRAPAISRLLTIALLSLGLSLSGALPARAEDAVSIPDPALKACLTKALSGAGIKTGLTAANLAKLTSLSCGGDGTLKDLSGIENLSGVSLIDLFDTSISDVAALCGLTKLRELIITSDRGFSLTPLAELPTLIALTTSVGTDTDLSELAGFTHLTDLELQTTGLAHLPAFTVPGTVSTLIISGDNALTGLGVIGGGSKVRTLSVMGSSHLTSLDGVEGLTGVTSVQASATEVSDISALSGMTGLTQLYLTNAAVRDLSPLADLASLSRLDLSGNHDLVSTGALARLANMADLSLRMTKVDDLAALAKMNKLTQLDVSGTRVTDLTPLAGLPSLTSIDASYAAITQLGPRGALSHLTRALLYANKISSLEALTGARLAYVDLSDNPITDVRPLAGVPSTATVNLSYAGVRDLSPLPDTVNVTAISQSVDLPSATVGTPGTLGILGIDGTPLCPGYFWTVDPVNGRTNYSPGATCASGVATYPSSGTYHGWVATPSYEAPRFEVRFTQHAGPDRPFTRTTKPWMGGQPAIANPLMANASAWTPQAASYSYQWYRNGKRVTGVPEDHSSYTPTPADFGARFSVCMIGHRDGYRDARRCSGKSDKVWKGALNVLGDAKIVGVRAPGSTLTAKLDVLESGVTFHYQWQRDYNDIKGATHKTYKVRARDVGHRLRVMITLTKKWYDDYPTGTNFTKVKKATMRAATPTILGEAKVGSQLSATTGAWSPGATLSYQWYRNGKAIKKATHRTYLLTTADRGARIVVKVTGRKAGFTTVRRSSAATERVS